MSLLELRGLTHIYSKDTPFEKVALDHIDLTIDAGQIVGLIGHTGSGKSTLIGHLNALLKPTTGTVLLDGRDIFASKAAIREARFRVGVVFQYPEYQLFEETVYADIAYGPKNLKLSREEIDRRVREASAFVGLEESSLDQSPLALSGGQKRRAAIAGVLAMEPAVLVLDEPTAGLDPAGREELLVRLFRWREIRDATVLLVTHDMTAAAGCGRLIVMNDGRIAMDGTPREVFARGTELLDMGLDIPGAAKIALLLRTHGAAVPEDVYTVPGLCQAVLALRRKGA